MNRSEIIEVLKKNGFFEYKPDRWYLKSTRTGLKRGCVPVGILRFRFLPCVLRLEVSTRGDSGQAILSWARVWSGYYAFLTPEAIEDALSRGG